MTRGSRSGPRPWSARSGDERDPSSAWRRSSRRLRRHSSRRVTHRDLYACVAAALPKTSDSNCEPWSLSCKSRVGLGEEVVGLAGDLALEAADGLAPGEPVGFASRGVGLGARVEPQATGGGHVQGAVGGAVAAAVEAVALWIARGGGRGAEPQSIAQAGSLLRRSGWSPAVMSSWAQIWVPNPTGLSTRGASSSTNGVISSRARHFVDELEDPPGEASQRDPGRDGGVAEGDRLWARVRSDRPSGRDRHAATSSSTASMIREIESGRSRSL
jgi:hypothetical protein